MIKSTIYVLFALWAVSLFTACGEKASDPESNSNPESQAQTSADPSPSDVAAPLADGKPRQLTGEEQKQVIDEVMRVRAKQQAEGLGTGTVKVNGAWKYSGYSTLTPDPAAAIEARLVAVDVTISGHTPFFDIDDIELIDGITMLSYGSDPHAEYLKLDGTLMGAESLPAEAPKASRWLLIYAFPKNTPRFHLYYWGTQLTPTPVEIGESGFGLPYPATQ